ncbi:MAG TPA: trypsin-like peptidase domain-containing protein [Polyangiaceae bacterium]|nr:trypsin-like peptidase domain-containing protein [Polyangiaceae bacterium]
MKRSFAAFALALALGGCRDGAKTTERPAPSAAPSIAPAPSYVLPEVPPPPSVPEGARLPSFADLSAKANPAVVYIETEQAMFGHGRRIVAGGVGAGFVFDSNGLILTNHHVVAGATRIEAVFGEENRRHATIVGADPPTDIAVLRVDASGLPSLPLGDSSRARVGDWVVAIGNPFGLSHTVSVGILSAKGRTRNDVKGLDASGYYDYLQTDASINPGNSGGPLLDLDGRVIGINTAIKPEANGIGFAIPIDMVRELLPALVEHGKVTRSALGVAVASVKDEDVTRLGLGSKSGALVTRVVRGGPGDRGGLRVDDVIVAFEDTVGEGPNRLRFLTSIAGVGKVVHVKVVRGRSVVELPVTLGELPNPESGEAP